MKNDFSAMDSDFNTSGAGIKASLTDRKGGSPLTKPGGNYFQQNMYHKIGQLKLGNKT